MDTIVTVTYRLKDWTPDKLRQAIHDLDELDAGSGNGIDAQRISGDDIMMYVHLGELGLKYDIITSTVEAVPSTQQ